MLIFGVAALPCLAIAIAAARPLATDDLWWHLALGRAYAEQGPWLAADPLLFTAPGAPAPAAWLASTALHGVLQVAGFHGLRCLHVLLVVALLTLAARQLLRTSGSTLVAAAGTALVASCASYRLIQLRPEISTLIATLVLLGLLLDSRTPMRPWRLAGIFVLFALWANLHAGFVLGLVLIGAALTSLVAAQLVANPRPREACRRRIAALAGSLAAAGLGSLLNPAGLAAYHPILSVGAETPSLRRVADEWGTLPLLTWPAGVEQAFGWAVWWSLLLATVLISLLALRDWRRHAEHEIDPVQIGLAVAGLVAMSVATRFLWLAILPLLLVASALRKRKPPALVVALAGVTIVLGFFTGSDGRRVRAELPQRLPDYAAPFHAARYFAHSTWIMADARLEGRLFSEYAFAGFHGYWLAPRIGSFVNGSLNVVPEAMDANLPLRARGARGDLDFLALLDHWQVDFYLGIRLPETGPTGRPWFATTTHLEGAPGWIPVFRNLRSALYLRVDARNRANLERLSAYYAEHDVPFDPQTGFDVARVIDEAPDFALATGIVPRDFPALIRARDSGGGTRRRVATDRLSSIYAVLGLHELAIEQDRRLVARRPTSLATRRLVWSLLRVGRPEEALEAAGRLVADRQTASISQRLHGAARALAASGQEYHPLTPPFLTRAEAAGILQGYVWPKVRAAGPPARSPHLGRSRP